MNRFVPGAAIAALALLTFFQFPGHTWLQQDTQIYAPLLEHRADPSVLGHDMLVENPQAAFTVYDDVAVGLHRLTGLGFREILEALQIATRALGIWGLYLMAESIGFAMWPSLLIAAIVSLGATVNGPQVLSIEYEPTPRAFAVPLLMLAIGLAARRQFWAAAWVSVAAFLLHPPTAAPVWLALAFVLVATRRYRVFWALAAGVAAFAVIAHFKAAPSIELFSRLTDFDRMLQARRSSYLWISTWPARTIIHYLICFAAALGAAVRLRGELKFELRAQLLALAAMAILSMPASWLLLESLGLKIVPQLQPMRALLFVTLAMQFLSAAAAVKCVSKSRYFEAAAWFAAAYLIPAQPIVTEPLNLKIAAVVAALAMATAFARKYGIAVAAAAYFAIPLLGGVVNYPQLHTPELEQLSAWARSSTSKDAVFLFPDAGRNLAPGIFRSEARRAVYVDWKAGGQVNYIRGFGELWWRRWETTMAGNFRPGDIKPYRELGISYLVLRPGHRLASPAVFENGGYVVYAAP
jgi:Domain of unknown function (DUF6798)